MLGEISINQRSRWHQPYGRKWRTKELLDENEREEWKIWLKISTFKELRSWLLIQSLLSKGMEKQWKELRTLFWGVQNCCRCWLHHEIKTSSWEESYDQTRQHTKKQRHCFANKGPYSKSYGFSTSHVWMWDLDSKDSWGRKNWCF